MKRIKITTEFTADLPDSIPLEDAARQIRFGAEQAAERGDEVAFSSDLKDCVQLKRLLSCVIEITWPI
jgi:hypothetical protein